jgi:hypothetical protein
MLLARRAQKERATFGPPGNISDIGTHFKMPLPRRLS